MISPDYDEIEYWYMAEMVSQIVYMLSNWDKRVSYVWIMRYNFTSAFWAAMIVRSQEK